MRSDVDQDLLGREERRATGRHLSARVRSADWAVGGTGSIYRARRPDAPGGDTPPIASATVEPPAPIDVRPDRVPGRDRFERACADLTAAQRRAVDSTADAAVHRGRGRIGQDPRPDPAGGPPDPRRLGRGRPHRRVHVHPQGGPRVARPAGPLRGPRLDPRRPRGGARPRASGPARSTSSPSPCSGAGRLDAGQPPPVPGRAPPARPGRAVRRPGDRLGRRHRDRLGQGPVPDPGQYAAAATAGRRSVLPLEPVADALHRLPGPARPARPPRPRRRPAAGGRPPPRRRQRSPSRPTGATGTWPSTSSRTSTRPSSA